MSKTLEKKSKPYSTKETEISSFNELDLNKTYSYADYLKWQIAERVELIKGLVLKMSPAPSLHHQRVSRQIFTKIANALEGKKCEVFSAPFDVRFPKESTEDEAIFNIVQPDICVVCDPSKLDNRGCLGAPDLIIEILSSSSSQRDLVDKYELYESNGVKEYWVAHPEEQSLLIYTLNDKGKYQASKLFARGETISSSILPGFELHLSDIFEERKTEF